MQILVINDEDQDAEIVLEIKLVAKAGEAAALRWATAEKAHEAVTESGENSFSYRFPESLNPSDTHETSVEVQAKAETECILEVKASYSLAADPETPMCKSFTTNMTFVKPFEASYKVIPEIDRDLWPNYFSLDTDLSSLKDPNDGPEAEGLTQHFAIIAKLASSSPIQIQIEEVGLNIVGQDESVLCTTENTKSPPGNVCLGADDIHDTHFDLRIAKMEIDDREPVSLSPQIDVRWRRNDSTEPQAVTSITLPDLLIPFGEPRVLAWVPESNNEEGLTPLNYTIENPSTHFLTFSVSMDTSEEFAFSGPKMTTLQLTPLSRKTVQYHIFPMVRGSWISPQFRVVDVHFHKSLKIHATEGMEADKRGVSVWIDTDE